MPEDTDSRLMPEDTDSRLMSEDTDSRLMPEDTNSRLMPEDTDSRLMPEDTDSRPHKIHLVSQIQAMYRVRPYTWLRRPRISTGCSLRISVFAPSAIRVRCVMQATK